MQPTPARPRRDDERNAWLPFVIVAALIVLLFLALIIVFRRDDEVERAEGSLPLSFDPVPSAPASTTTASTIPPATPPPVVVPTTKAPGGSGSSRTDAPSLASTTLPLVGGSAEALAQAAERAAATKTSDIVPIGADLYAMILVNGRAQLLRWNVAGVGGGRPPRPARHDPRRRHRGCHR